MESAYAGYRTRMGGQRLPPLETDYGAEIAHYPAWVAVTEDRLVGGLIMTLDPPAATLMNVAVSPDFQGRGLGRGLMDFAEMQARKRHCGKIALATHELLTENAALYEYLGWQRVGADGNKLLFEKVL